MLKQGSVNIRGRFRGPTRGHTRGPTRGVKSRSSRALCLSDFVKAFLRLRKPLRRMRLSYLQLRSFC